MFETKVIQPPPHPEPPAVGLVELPLGDAVSDGHGGCYLRVLDGALRCRHREIPRVISLGELIRRDIRGTPLPSVVAELTTWPDGKVTDSTDNVAQGTTNSLRSANDGLLAALTEIRKKARWAIKCFDTTSMPRTTIATLKEILELAGGENDG